MSNPIKCPCDCPASILDKQNYENYKRLTENRECAPAYQNDQKCEYHTNNNECENRHKNNHISDDNECMSYSQCDQKYKRDDNVCVAHKKSDLNLKSHTDNNKCVLCNENYNKTQHAARNSECISNKQSQDTSQIESDYKECLTKLREYEKRLKTDENVSETKSVISQRKDENLIHKNETCLKVLQKNISQLYASSDQNCFKEKARIEQEKPEAKQKCQIKCTEDQLKIQYSLSPLTLPSIKCDDQDQLKIQHDLAPLTMPSIKCDDQEKLELQKKCTPPLKSSSSNLKKCIGNVCSKICKKFKDIEKNLASDKEKSNLPASSGLSSNSSTGSHKNFKSSVRSKSSKSDKSNKSSESISKKSSERSEVVIISRAQQKFYEFEKKPPKACSPKSSSKSIKTGECNSNCTCCKKSWW
ncbi:unnamed protein product [Arctia plantaginis]|uniref:Uncharacterized protein n=1 Tax=Arctia plantaginis TaxID=874455 RepID=A0A8S0ZGS1_ARCPL|nr:unnamed protein product [Arctia plantaginis]